MELRHPVMFIECNTSYKLQYCRYNVYSLQLYSAENVHSHSEELHSEAQQRPAQEEAQVPSNVSNEVRVVIGQVLSSLLHISSCLNVYLRHPVLGPFYIIHHF